MGNQRSAHFRPRVQHFAVKLRFLRLGSKALSWRFSPPVQQNINIDALKMATSNARKYLTEEELKRLLQVIKKPRDRAIFTVCYWRGLRASEVGRIPLSGWRRSVRRIYIVRLKGSLSGEYPLSPAEHRALTAWVKERGDHPGPLFPSRESGRIGAGITRTTLHRLMKRYATEAG